MFLLYVVTQLSAEGVVIKTTISIGRKSQDCDGFGICSAKVATTNQPSLINGTFNFNQLDNNLLVCINASDLQSIQPEKMIHFVHKPTVSFVEDFPHPMELLSELNTNTPIIIKTGVYKLTLKDGIYTIVIHLL